MQFISRRLTLIAFSLAAVFCCARAVADGGMYNPYRDQDITGGIITEIKRGEQLIVREKTGSERYFVQIDGNGRLDTIIKVEDRTTSFRALKVGMRVQIVFYRSQHGQRTGGESDPFPMKSIRAVAPAAEHSN
jgi:hypothetical protein